MRDDSSGRSDALAAESLEALQEALAGRYTIEREIGRGGMAIVYLAVDLKHDRRVAIKVLRPEFASSVGAVRFLREIRIEAGLQHPNIVSLIDSGQAGELPYYVMTFLEGESLRDRLRREHQLPINDALQITREVGEALGYAHGQGIIHRDIKPGNILLTRDHACVADLGIAQAVAVAGGDQLTDTGIVVGTPDYMSPEQGAGDAGLGPRSDLYSLACVLYEMLAGEPPFTGRTSQAVIARHLSESPPSLRIVRPTVPPGIQTVIERALAKVPADRFASVGEFLQELENKRTYVGSPLPLGIRKRRAAAAAVTLALVAGVVVVGPFRSWLSPNAQLDPNRVVVFPFRDEAGVVSSAGEGVATYIGYALEGIDPLRWLDGIDFLGEDRSRTSPISAVRAKALSQARRARYYIDGAIIRGGDSVTVVARLYDVAGDSLVQRTGAAASASAGSLPQLGLRAVAELLPALLQPGRRVDLTPLSERRPTSIAAFLEGEREYRLTHFMQALKRYRAAVAGDSAFALAALKGAQSANWLRRNDEADSLVMVALANPRSLSTRYQHFGHGLKSYFRGSADSAVRSFRQALAADSTWSEAWMALGEVYYHLLPLEATQDSLATAAFETASKADPEFTPPLLHLAEIAIRRGDVPKAEALVQRFKGADPDAGLLNDVTLMLQCVGGRPGAPDWSQAVKRDASNALNAAKLLSVRAAQPECAAAGFSAVLASDSAPVNLRWGALLGLQGLLVAAGRVEELRKLLDSEAARNLGAQTLYLPIAASGFPVEAQAAQTAEVLGRDYHSLSVPVLWALGVWAAHRNRSGTLALITSAVQAKADSSRARRDDLVARVLSAYLILANGDTVQAIERFAALTPSAPPAELEWQPWESLGGERLTLASLYFSRRQFARAHDFAALLDASEPVFYLNYVRPSLALRGLAADSLRDRMLGAQARHRLSTLDHPSAGSP